MSYFETLTANARKQLIASSGGDEGYLKTIDAVAKAKKAVEERLLDHSKPPAAGAEPFIFSMVVFITYEDFFATSCAYWKGPTFQAPTFADVKLTDFHESYEKLGKIFAAAKSSDSHERRGVVVENYPNEIKLRFTHRLFEKRQEGDEEVDRFRAQLLWLNSINIVLEGVPPELTIHHWPAASERAKQALVEMAHTHRVNYLQAFDATPKGKIIGPDAYKRELRGALAQVRFTLSHWDIRNKAPRDVFNANIVHIRILAPRVNASASPSKRPRNFTAEDTVSGDISPKKARVGP
ncbi:hypothetical protein DFH07DRAFT_949496 [Mycena maculata]|uniref:Uncharacterized protein n=1 Tax=Mycena maculata TaxID=230809 RepID=A0AAD7KCM3_9AGAR|nr:hypothetical protein DFH07DRAFT_949496 [Mycena maculata]